MQNHNDENSTAKSPEKDTEVSPVKTLSKNDTQNSESVQEPIKDIFDSSRPQSNDPDDHNIPPSSRVDKFKSKFNYLLMTMQPEEDFEDDGKLDAEMRAENKQRRKENNSLHNLVNLPKPTIPAKSQKSENAPDTKVYQPKKQKPTPSVIPEPITADVTTAATEKKTQEKQQELPEYDIFADSPFQPDKQIRHSDTKPPAEPKKETATKEIQDTQEKITPKAGVYDVKADHTAAENQPKAAIPASSVPTHKQGRKKKKKNKNKISAPAANSAVSANIVSTPVKSDTVKSELPKEKEPAPEKIQEEKISPETAKEEKAAEQSPPPKASDNTIFRRTDTPKETASNHHNELNTDDDIKIIPWNSKKQEKNESEKVNPESKDFSEGHIKGVIYHESISPPFVVMAGKFTRTLRSEYEYVRIYNKALVEKQKKEAAQNTAKQKEGTPEKIKKPVNTNRQPPIRKKSNFEPLDTVPKNTKTTVGTTASGTSASVASKQSKQSKPSKTQTVKTSQTIQTAQTVQDQRPPMPEMRRKKWKLPSFSLKGMLSGEEEYDPEETTIEEQIEKPLLDDYNEAKDAEEIKSEIGTNFRVVFVRTSILLAALVASVILAVLAQCTLLFKSSRNGWLVYALLNFIVFSVSVIASRLPIVNGLMPLRHFKGNADTAVAVASFAAAIQSITAIFTPHMFVNGTLHIYVPLVILALFLNNLGRLLIILRASENFRFLIKPFPKYAGKIYTDVRTAEKMVSEFPNKKPLIAYTKRSKFMSNFLQLSYAPDPSEVLASKSAPITTAISIVFGILDGILKKDFAAGVSSFALTACISTPMICLLAINIPLLKLCRNSLRGGAMVTSYETVKQFCDTNAIMLDSSQLYPKGTITLSGMKAFKQSKLNDAITAGAAVMYAVNGPMCGVFDNIVQCSKSMLPRVDSVVYEDNKGLVGWVGGQRILIGNRDLLESHNVKAPDPALEERYRDDFNEISYITVGGELIAMFVLAYKPDREIIHELRNLEENGVSFVIRTVDPNVTRESVAKKFYLYHRCITILPTGLGTIGHNAMSSVDDRSRAYLVTRGKISSFARAVSGCIRIKSNVTISKILQYVAIVLGLVLVTVISFVSGFEKLGNIEMLIYLGFWALASTAVSMIKK